MDKKIDVHKVDAALKRAARTAVTGSREARSGRFMDVKPYKRSTPQVQNDRAKPKRSR